MKKLIAGNWKMNGSTDQARTLVADVINRVSLDEALFKVCDVLVCPPFVHISAVRHAVYGFPRLAFGGQDCAAFENGAYTGEISAAMLKDSGCSYVIVGHSERRQVLGERDEQVQAKARRALDKDLCPIICVGETDSERSAGQALAVVEAQIMASVPELGGFEEIVIAYEPVWAIGTGKTATSADITEMHAHIRSVLAAKVKDPSRVRILYGGSVKAENAGAIFACPNVDGALIGGASLDAGQFVAIARAAKIQ